MRSTLSKTIFLRILLCQILLLSLFIFPSCTADEEITQSPVATNQIQEARKILTDSIVLNATAMQGSVNKTLLDKGCPLKYYFTWKNDDIVKLQIREFSVGTMPIKIWFSIDCKFMQLNSWEKEEYKGTGWIKFQGRGGSTVMEAIDEGYEDGNGGAGTVQGYLNVDTHEIEFVTNFNVMNFSSDVYPQKVDSSRMERFEEEFAQYEKELAEYKKEHGIS